MLPGMRCFLAIFFILSGNASSLAQEAGTVARMSGKAAILSIEGVSRDAKVNDPVNVGEVISTTAGAEVVVKLKDNSTMIVRAESKVKIGAFRFERKAGDTVKTNLLSGALRAVSGQIAKGQPDNVKYESGAATIGIRGTDIELAIIPEGKKDRAGIYNYVHSGETLMMLDTGESVVIEKDMTGFNPQTLKPGEARLQLLRDRPAFLSSGGFDALLQQLTSPRIPMIR